MYYCWRWLRVGQSDVLHFWVLGMQNGRGNSSRWGWEVKGVKERGRTDDDRTGQNNTGQGVNREEMGEGMNQASDTHRRYRSVLAGLERGR